MCPFLRLDNDTSFGHSRVRIATMAVFGITKLSNILTCPYRHYGRFRNRPLRAPACDRSNNCRSISWRQQQWRLAQRVLAVAAAAHQATGVEDEAEDVGELQPAGGLEEEEVEIAVALEVAEDKDNGVRIRLLGTREIRQTEVSFMVLSLFVT